MYRSYHHSSGPVRARALLLLTLTATASGCAQLGPGLMEAGRNDYNKVLAQTDDEETLLNLVRLRYADRPAFLQVNSVSTSFTWNQGAQAEAFRFDPSSSDSRVGARGPLDYTERPTITYTPLGGTDFVQNVLTPIKLDLLQLLARSGWSTERLLRLTVNRMNGIENAPEATGPTPLQAPEFEDFILAAELWQALQKRHMVTMGYRKVGEEITSGIRFEPESQGARDVRAFSELLGINPGQGLITLDTRSRLRRPDAIGVETRSLAGILILSVPRGARPGTGRLSRAGGHHSGC
jgi:hypothetical protein